MKGVELVKCTIEAFERVIIIGLIVLMMVAIAVSAVELGIILHQQLMAEPRYLLDINEMLTVFGFFMMVLIGLELLETIKTYLNGNLLHVEVVLLVAMIAISRKVVILKIEEMEAWQIFGMAALIISLAAGYFLVKRARGRGEHDAHNTMPYNPGPAS